VLRSVGWRDDILRFKTKNDRKRVNGNDSSHSWRATYSFPKRSLEMTFWLWSAKDN
jgi:hypothetical protein